MSPVIIGVLYLNFRDERGKRNSVQYFQFFLKDSLALRIARGWLFARSCAGKPGV